MIERLHDAASATQREYHEITQRAEQMLRIEYPTVHRQEYADIVQEAWVRVTDQRARQEIEHLRAYFLTTVRSIIRDRDAKKKLPTVPITDRGTQGTAEPASSEEAIGEQVAKRQELRMLDEALGRLPAQQARAMRLKWYADMNPIEIAEHMGISDQAARSLLKRGNAAIAAVLVAIRQGSVCEIPEVRTLMLALADGRLARNSDRWRQAVEHGTSCTACARLVLDRRAELAHQQCTPRAVPTDQSSATSTGEPPRRARSALRLAPAPEPPPGRAAPPGDTRRR
ncbi:sigma-70 family RNA polymerase sigma factor [Conexibacter sp. W3-3-2]|uniref:sigma-70 family RNA polymerase sigma factor n=1 Tax=Conexibacter sp. W3-3-2 TaxID=2675227 RepID=UPI0012B959BD|nr:sigma-70 family RNA polymerase sigma factor [Conexibacter sp. W3-3-2]MTD47226.1 sigma-70 family RNA polymerase sigma factor [Conexibacter sp. W3-3-2]